MTRTEIVSLAAVAAAWTAAIFTVVYALYTKAQLRIAREQERRREPRLDIYVVESYAYRPQGGASRTLLIQLLVRNPTDSENAIAMLEMRVTYVMPNRSEFHLRLPHNAALTSAVAPARPFEIPTQVPAHGAVQGWALLELPDAVAPSGEIAVYEVLLTDSHGIPSTQSVSLLPELVDGEEAEES
ncbi:MAG TPA: hypothetical protein ENH00_09160 [Actinobacteria bacterium]|nr:hypothetical protein [Actinomycetota bacterium]